MTSDERFGELVASYREAWAEVLRLALGANDDAAIVWRDPSSRDDAE